MPPKRFTALLVSLSFFLCVFKNADAQLVLGQIDDFQDLTTQNWSEGALSPNPPMNISSGGPGGAGDAFLQLISSGGAGSGSRMVAFNSNQWSGDYTGLFGIAGFLNNLGGTTLEMRVAFEAAGGTWFSSTNSIALSPGSGWTQVFFSFDEQDMTQIQGSLPYSQAISNVPQLRILSAASPAFRGDLIAGTLGVDSLTAVAIPVPGAVALLGSGLIGFDLAVKTGPV